MDNNNEQPQEEQLQEEQAPPKRPPSARQQRMAERNQVICQQYMEGRSLASIGKPYGLKRQRVKQIVQAAGLWRERVVPDRKFLGINISDADKAALREEAARLGLSMSAITADWIRERLIELRRRTETQAES